jgi:3-oxoacyl-[acyl-carrier protein] reductase
LDRLRDMVIIVTGGANGIGRVYCEHLASAGARLLIADLDEVGAHALAEKINESTGQERATAACTDVTSEDDTRVMAEQAVQSFGRIDVLINNAGSYPHVDFEDISYEHWKRVVAVNLDSVFLCSRAVLGQMKSQQSGKIINVATNLVWSGLASMVHYISAKAGVVGFTRALAREVGEHGITVNALAPGAVVPEGRLTEERKERVASVISYQCIRRGQRPEDLVGTMLFLASPDSDFISGQVFTVDGGLTTH